MQESLAVELGEEYGIRTPEPVSERGTSKTCFLCHRQHNGRKERGLMVCPTVHQCINADVNGAANMYEVAAGRPLLRSTNELAVSGSGLLAQPLLRRWGYHAWLSREQEAHRL